MQSIAADIDELPWRIFITKDSALGDHRNQQGGCEVEGSCAIFRFP
jgi:hypothetical protein